MSDLISRQAVLDLLSHRNAAWDAYQMVKELPSAEKTGMWVEAKQRGCVFYSNAYAECTQCHEPVYMG